MEPSESYTSRDLIKVHFVRKKTWMAHAMKFRIIIDGNNVAEIKAGKEMTIDIPFQKIVPIKLSMKGNVWNIHKIEKEMVLFPEFCTNKTIECLVNTKTNWLGFISMGLLQAVCNIEVDLIY